MTLEEIRDQLIEWACRGKHANKDNLHIKIHREDGRSYVKLRLLTVTNSYGIRVIPSKNAKMIPYMCCEYSHREPLPGETWTRGGDLWDGNFDEDGWDRIVADILSVELATASEVPA